MRWKSLKLALLFLLIGITAAWAQAQIDIPPEPSRPDTAGLPSLQAAEAIQKWRADHDRWDASLTSEQRAEVGRLRQEARERFGRLPVASDGYVWQSVAAAQNLSESGIKQLAANKILIGRREYRQSFEPYEHAVIPVFITSDSLLNGFHVLFEDTFRELEIRNAVQLRRNLEQTVTDVRAMLKASSFPSSAIAPAWNQAQLAIGPAMVLLGTALDFFDPEVRAEISTQVRKIQDASVVELPSWLAPATDAFLAIDYRRLKPVGFYSNGALLSDYFRAVRWLQMVPFRVERDNELGAIGLLGFGARQRNTGSNENFFATYEKFLGPVDGRSLKDAHSLLPDQNVKTTGGWAEALQAKRTQLAFVPAHRQLNDDLHKVAHNESVKPPLSFRVLAPYRLPDAELFQVLIDHNEPVTGLQVATLAGSRWAEAKVKATESEFASLALKDAKTRLRREEERAVPNVPLYNDYLGVIGSLFGPADPDAPSFMGGEAWSAKSCQTALAGWTQMRHTFTLQAKMSMVVFGMHDLPPGFIEPNPAFLRNFWVFLEHTHSLLEAEGVFSPTAESVSAALIEKADLIDRLCAKIKTVTTSAELEEIPEYREYNDSSRTMGFQVDMIGVIPVDTMRAVIDAEEPAALASALPQFSSQLRLAAKRYESGELKPKPERDYESLSGRWHSLQQMVGRLETLLQKQLRQREWNVDEAAFIKEYGSNMANIMGYFGNMNSPRDDSPRWVEVVRDPRRNQSFVAATGRPRAFFVLYPWRGMELLCEGSILPYYEYQSAGTMTDSEWVQQLDSSSVPTRPDWIQSISESK